MKRTVPNAGISLVRLRSFVTVAEEMQFKRAGERLGLTQPAITIHLQELEEFLGVVLFRRTTRRVELTAEGARFLARVRRAFTELDAGIHEMRDYASPQRGRLVVAAVPSITSKLLPSVFREFGDQFPNVHIDVMELMASEIERAIHDGEADIGIIPRPAKKANLAFAPLFVDRFLAVVPAAHPLARRKTTTLRELSNQPIITMRRGSNIRDSIEMVFVKNKQKFVARYVVAQPETALAMVDAQLGISILPTVYLNESLSVATVPIKPAIKREIGIVSRSGGALSAIAVEFVRRIEKIISQGRTARSNRRNEVF
jgi:LysR family carnitine catabolism transcriptional activator